MSALGQTRSFDDVRETSALPRLATNERTLNEVRLVPQDDVTALV
jgi:hypothetical protein